MRQLFLFGCLIIAAGLYAAEPAQNVGMKKHPHLATAQDLISQAFEKIEVAQKANEFDMGGHAQKAKNLLEQASQEIKLAAVDSNQNEKKPGHHNKPEASMNQPGTNVGGGHPNLAAAQDLINQAFMHVGEAQKANEFDLGGHAAKAKDYLEQANAELKLAAEKAAH
jgi:hypothetical protein